MNKIKGEQGVVFVEASIVFPIVFLMILLLVYLGNAFYQKARVEAIVTETALDAAAYLSDPLLKSIETTGSIPGLDEVDIEPYRFIFKNGDSSAVENTVKSEIETKLNSLSTGYFSNMKPEMTSGIETKYNRNFLASSFSIEFSYKINLPIRLIGMKENFAMRLSSYTEVPVSASAEFVRDVDMVEDYMEAWGIVDKISAAVEKVKSWFHIS